MSPGQTGQTGLDIHGEPTKGKDGEFNTYGKQKNLTEAQGSFTATYDGRMAGTGAMAVNCRGELPVTIQLKTTGFYKDLFEPPAE
jgi:hypothetical protein